MPHITLVKGFPMDGTTIATILQIVMITTSFILIVVIRSNRKRITLLEALVEVLKERLDIHEEDQPLSIQSQSAPK